MLLKGSQNTIKVICTVNEEVRLEKFTGSFSETDTPDWTWLDQPGGENEHMFLGRAVR
jgi:hypothetical protein